MLERAGFELPVPRGRVSVLPVRNQRFEGSRGQVMGRQFGLAFDKIGTSPRRQYGSSPDSPLEESGVEPLSHLRSMVFRPTMIDLYPLLSARKGSIVASGTHSSNLVCSGKESATNLTGKIEPALASGDTRKPT